MKPHEKCECSEKTGLETDLDSREHPPYLVDAERRAHGDGEVMARGMVVMTCRGEGPGRREEQFLKLNAAEQSRQQWTEK